MRAGGGSQTRITASISQGTVTLTGTLQYAIQRTPLVKAVSQIAGVRRVIDQLKLVPAVKPDYTRREPVTAIDSDQSLETAAEAPISELLLEDQLPEPGGQIT
jgi:hypothetical protein